MENITVEILEEFKERMHLGDDENENLRRILSASVKALEGPCGDRDINTDEEFKELVFERARYVYNDALEFFEKNFLTRITTLGIEKALEEMSDADETV